MFAKEPALLAEWRVAVDVNDGWLPLGLLSIAEHIRPLMGLIGVVTQKGFADFCKQ